MAATTVDGLRTAIEARIARPSIDGDQLVPDHAARMIDRVMEDVCDQAFAVSAQDTDAGRFARIYVYYTEFLARVAPSLHAAAARHFEQYMAALIRGAQAPRYEIWSDGVEVHAA